MISYGMSGHFRMEVRDSEGKNVLKVREFDNLILDNGLNQYGAGTSNNVTKCWVGTGTKTPEVTDTALEIPLVSANRTGNDVITKGTAPDYVSSIRKQYNFAVGTAAGNLTEIGLSTGDATPSFWCRALITNEAGVPEALEVGSNNTLYVYYTLRLHPHLEDSSFSFDFGGVTYNCVSRPADIANSQPGSGASSVNIAYGIEVTNVYKGGELGAITGGITGATASEYVNDYYTGAPTAQAYVQDSFYRDYSQPFPLNYCNLNGGIDGFLIGWRTVGNYGSTGGQFLYKTQVKMDKAIPKDNTCAFRLMLRTSWHRWTGV